MYVFGGLSQLLCRYLGRYEIEEEAEKVVGVIKVRGTKISGTNNETKPQRFAVTLSYSWFPPPLPKSRLFNIIKALYR
jgi:hypothetical protein